MKNHLALIILTTIYQRKSKVLLNVVFVLVLRYDINQIRQMNRIRNCDMKNVTAVFSIIFATSSIMALFLFYDIYVYQLPQLCLLTDMTWIEYDIKD